MLVELGVASRISMAKAFGHLLSSHKALFLQLVAWELYFEERLSAQMASTLTGPGTVRYLWLQQHGKCLVCGQPLTPADEWHVHHLRWRAHGGDDLNLQPGSAASQLSPR